MLECTLFQSVDRDRVVDKIFIAYTVMLRPVEILFYCSLLRTYYSQYCCPLILSNVFIVVCTNATYRQAATDDNEKHKNQEAQDENRQA